MDDSISIRITGEAGQGIQTIGAALCAFFKGCGAHLFAAQDYMSRVRGGNNFFEIRVSSFAVSALREKPGIVIALDKRSVEVHKPFVSEGGIMVIDSGKFGASEDGPVFFDAPLYRMSGQAGGSELFVNSVACGIITGIMRADLSRMQYVLKDILRGKPAELIDKNTEAVRLGFEFARDNFKSERFSLKSCSASAGERILLNGNEAIALGAIRAGCKFYSAYPMTPSTSIMDTVAHFSRKFNICVEQAEDEIAAVNMAIGASFAGCRSMAATSGGGFALMVEGLSLAGMTETPLVVVDAQRPGPATGFPTRTEQADLNFLIHAGHGEFARAIYAPGTIEEAFYLTVRAFNTAEKYQIPALIMTDQHLADSYRDVEPFDLEKAAVERHIISKEDSRGLSGYKRYLLTDSGISPRAIPSWIEDVVYVDSDEHNEEGHITEDAATRVKMVEKRLYKKMAYLTQEVVAPSSQNIDKAESVLVGFGSTYGVMKEACGHLGSKFGFIHLSQVWPFPAAQMLTLLKKKKRILTVENNAGAQLAGLLMRETGISADCSILRYDGRPFNLEYLFKEIEELGQR